MEENYLEGFKTLRVINLSRNRLFSLPDLHWIQHSLSSVFASSNGVLSLSAFDTSGVFEILRFIDVSQNNIRNFDITLMHHMP